MLPLKSIKTKTDMMKKLWRGGRLFAGDGRICVTPPKID
jgi:hypothetical protein